MRVDRLTLAIATATAAMLAPRADGQSETSPQAAAVSAWSTGGASATAKPGEASGPPTTATAPTGIPYWQAPALPAAVIQGGAIPPGWQPQAIPYRGIGPDGRVITQYYAPTYTFTYQAGPPVLAIPPATAVRRQVPVYRNPQLYGAAPAPYAPSWGVQQPVVPPPAVTTPPPAVARYAPWPQSTLAPALAAPTPPPTSWASAAAPPPVAGWTAAAAAPAAGIVADAAAPPTPPTAQPVATPAPTSTPPAMQPVDTPPPLATVAAPQTRLWRVVGVQDGDTVTCLDDLNQQRKVELADIDAPEIGQNDGKAAREALAGMVFGRTVQVVPGAATPAGVPTARLSVDGVDVSRQMVATGHAWQDPASSDAMLGAEQSQAQAAKIGLWADEAPTPPWQYRGSSSP